MSSQLLTATEFAKVCQVTPRTIRWYQQNGILKPVKIDHWNKYAYFSPSQALRVYKIKLLQQFNISLRRIKTLLNKKSLSLNEELVKLDKFIKEKQKELEFLKNFNSVIDIKIKMKLKKEMVGQYRLFSHKIEQGDYYKIDTYIRELKQIATSLGIKYKSSAIAFYYDEGYNPKAAKLEIALICIGKIPRIEKILPSHHAFREFHKCSALTFDFRGPYNFIEFVYNKFKKYIKTHKILITGPIFELYLNNPTDTKSPYDYLTKIVYPV